MNNDDYKYVEIEKNISKKEQVYKVISIIIILFILAIFTFITTMYFGFNFLLFLISFGTYSLPNYHVISILLTVLTLFLAIYLFRIGRKEKIIDQVKVNINDKNTCINCGNTFEIDKNTCPHCHYSSKYYYECACSTYNNFHRDKCINCNSEITINDKIKYLNKNIKVNTILGLLSFVLSMLSIFLNSFISFIIFIIESFFCLIKAYDYYLILQLLNKNRK